MSSFSRIYHLHTSLSITPVLLVQLWGWRKPSAWHEVQPVSGSDDQGLAPLNIQGGDLALLVVEDVVKRFAAENIPEVLRDSDIVKAIWSHYLENAEKYNDPGQFTATIDYE